MGSTLPDPFSSTRRVDDVRALRALTHPVRLALLEALTLEGPMTATQAGERLGETATTCSFHLRQLAKYGFVEEAGGGKGRARPWKVVDHSMSIAPDPGDVRAELAGSALVRIVAERILARYRTWLETSSRFSKEWQQAAGITQTLLYVTPDELDAIRGRMLQALPENFEEAITDPSRRSAGSIAVELVLFAHPMVPAGATPTTRVRPRLRSQTQHP